jgi:uncharacterized lipoprotein YddW (UPF0748 family)
MRHLLCLIAFLFSTVPALAADPAPLRREFRGVWVASVSNIDWPSKKRLSADEQKDELIAILDKCVALKLNAVILQVRPMCDALYASKLEPWSEYLTGRLGKDPGYDPLEFAVRQAHARGLELHAWFNPYRAHHKSATSPIPPEHIVKSRPDLAKPYGTNYWLIPTHPEVADHTLAVILDVVKRYDIDGVHLDDYFYPYAEKDKNGKTISFPDEDTWGQYQASFGQLSRGDWRRDAVNKFVERLYTEVKKTKRWVKVGISPFGIWRPGNPAGIEGFDQYEGLFADAKKWLNEGWVDYFAPQLYWPIGQEKQSYPKLLAWWAGENKKKRHLWPGNAAYRAAALQKGWSVEELAAQIRLTRAQAGATGNIHFSMRPLLENTNYIDDAFTEVYAEPALVPASTWLDNKPPEAPRVRRSAPNELRVRLVDDDVRMLVIQRLVAERWNTDLRPVKPADDLSVPMVGNPDRVIVTAVDRCGNASKPVAVGR